MHNHNQLFGKWKRDVWIRGVLVLSLLAFSPSLEAFGRGGGGGGRGGGGAGRGGQAGAARSAASRAAPARSVSSNRAAMNRGPTMRTTSAVNRTPSMSRVMSNTPSRANIPSRTNVSPQTRQINQVNQMQRQTGIRNASRIAQAGNQEGIQRIQSIMQQPNRGTLPNDWRQQRSAFRTQGDQLRDRVREDPRGYLQQGLRQGYQWWDTNRRPVGGDWRRRANWGALNTWLGWGAGAAPLYYDYADGLYYSAPATDGDYGGYNSGYAYPTYGDTYAAYPAYPTYSSEELAAAQANSWLPLGLFVMTSGAASTASPKWYLELAVDSQGNLEGYIYNAALNTTKEVEGVIDSTTQEARWEFTNQIGSPLFSTGAYNLTQGEATAQVTYPDGTATQLFLVRVDRNAAM